jgi:hypothetical protein
MCEEIIATGTPPTTCEPQSVQARRGFRCALVG